MKNKEYVWGWDEEGVYWGGGRTIIECLNHAKRNIMIQYTPEEFIELMNSHCLYVYITQDIIKKGYLAGKTKKYRLAMSGQWYLVKEK